MTIPTQSEIETRRTPQSNGTEQHPGRSPIGVIIASCAGICLIIVTCGAVYSVAMGHNIGSFEGGLGKLKNGSGLVGIIVVLYAIIQLVVNPTGKSTGEEKKVRHSKPGLLLIASAVMSFASAFVASGLEELAIQKESLTKEVQGLHKEVDGLKATRIDLLSFLGELTRRENIALLHKSVDTPEWQQAVSEIEKMENGQRKTTVLLAILLSWKSIPFKLGGSMFSDGVNSPAFFRHLLNMVKIDVPKGDRQRDSEALRAATDSVDTPMPGDFMFFRGSEPGSTGEYVMMYIGKSGRGSHGICLGVMGVKYPLQIVDASWLEATPNADQFRGYGRPHYQ